MTCNQSGNCCRQYHVVLSPQDLKELANYLGLRVKALFTRKLVTYKIETESGWMQPILNNRASATRDCPFLSFHENKAVCKVYKARPLVCRMFPRSIDQEGNWYTPEQNQKRCPGCVAPSEQVPNDLRERAADFLSHRKLVQEFIKAGLNIFAIKGNKPLQQKFFNLQEKLYEDLE